MLYSSSLGLLVMEGLASDDSGRPPAGELKLCPEAVKYGGSSGFRNMSFSSCTGTPKVGSSVSPACSKARCCERTCDRLRAWLIESIYQSELARSTSST